MPDDNDSTPPSEEPPSEERPSEDLPNRAERRRRGKDTSSAQPSGKVRDTGRRNAVQGPRHWSVRRGG
ncbi:hypothetical protein [Planosporangium mesophilum]|uniref:Uncharacterized protein n=1 Tax=Planosporangium mesophilum TaxID=689768 RepID=A0A8J3WY73_9ACTN|nr:hypothetical protein [Planosporangium mesophilum]NJC81456.1 hypothetical protein [Planosporangium mesophilum]GII20887.1 hypothetical protein Pme01_04840 [Planosporangium mesophilum]